MGNANLQLVGGACYSQETCESAKDGCACEDVSVGPGQSTLDGLVATTWQSATGEHSSSLLSPEHAASSSGHVLSEEAQRDTDRQCGGVQSIVTAMQGFSEDATVQIRACRSLAIIARQPVHKDKVVTADAIEAAVSAMCAHPANVELQLVACSVLEALAAVPDGQRRLLAADGATAMIAAMSNHPDSLAIQRAGCQTLVNMPLLLEDPSFTSTAVVVTAILSAMRLHPSDCGVQESACGILWCASLHDAGQALVIDSDGVAATITAMQMFPKEVTLQRLGCGLLLHIVSYHQLQGKVVDSAGLEAVISAVLTHASDLRVVRRAFGVLAFLSATEAFARVVVDEGGIDALVAGMSAHQSQMPVQETACDTLLALLAIQPAMTEGQVVKAVKELLSAVRHSRHEAKVIRLGLHCLYQLIWTDVGSRYARALGVVQEAMMSQEHHPDDIGIQEIVKAIKNAIAATSLHAASAASNQAAASSKPRTATDEQPPGAGPAALAAAAMAAELAKSSQTSQTVEPAHERPEAAGFQDAQSTSVARVLFADGDAAAKLAEDEAKKNCDENDADAMELPAEVEGILKEHSLLSELADLEESCPSAAQTARLPPVPPGGLTLQQTMAKSSFDSDGYAGVRNHGQESGPKLPVQPVLGSSTDKVSVDNIVQCRDV